MKTGEEPKKVAILTGLLIVVAVVLYINVFSGGSDAVSPTSRPVTASTPAPGASPTPAAKERRRSSRSASVSEFKIRLGVAPGQDKPDPATIDPTLRLDLLAKVQNVQPEGAM